MKQYLLNNAIAFDQQVNTLLGGSPDETLSARPALVGLATALGMTSAKLDQLFITASKL